MIFERVGVTWRLLKRLRVILIEVISSADLGLKSLKGNGSGGKK